MKYKDRMRTEIRLIVKSVDKNEKGKRMPIGILFPFSFYVIFTFYPLSAASA